MSRVLKAITKIPNPSDRVKDVPAVFGMSIAFQALHFRHVSAALDSAVPASRSRIGAARSMEQFEYRNFVTAMLFWTVNAIRPYFFGENFLIYHFKTVFLEKIDRISQRHHLGNA